MQAHTTHGAVFADVGFLTAASQSVTAQGFFVPEMVSRRLTERSKAAFHSALVMCVPASQNSMQAAKPSRPPPGVSSKLTPELPPVVRPIGTTVDVESDSGAIAKSWGCGAAI